MFEAMTALAERSVMERVVLLVNHVIRAEPAAMARLVPHAGRSIEVSLERWPVLLPSLPSMVFRVTPAGLVEWVERPGDALAERPADLRLTVDAANPASLFVRIVSGERPAARVDGDAAFASDVRWLVEHLRWDIEDDLARIVGDAPARAIANVGSMLARGLKQAARTIDDFADGRGRGTDDAAPPDPTTRGR